MNRAVIIGGGLAGLTAGVEIASRGGNVTIIEAKQVAGGRAKSPVSKQGKMELDWGQHLFMGCYTNTFRLLDILGTKNHLKPVIGKIEIKGRGGLSGKLPLFPLPFPLNLASSFPALSHISIPERVKIIEVIVNVVGVKEKKLRSLDKISALKWLESLNQSKDVIRKFWRILVVSALNEEPENVSAYLFAKVLKLAFFSGGNSSLPYLPDISLGKLIIQPAIKFIRERGGEIISGQRGVDFLIRNGKAKGVILKDGREIEGDIVICAIPPHELVPLLLKTRWEEAHHLVESISTFRYSPILTLFLRTKSKLIDSPYAGIIDGNFHWIFDRTKISNNGREKCSEFFDYSFVLSSAKEFSGLRKEEILKMCHEDIENIYPGKGGFEEIETVIIKETKATPVFSPGSDSLRPNPEKLLPRGILLAGDWVSTGLPATIESAVTSGFHSAHLAV